MMAELWTMSTVPGAFWFPDQELTLKDLTPDLADYYLYDLRRGRLAAQSPPRGRASRP